MYGKWILLLLLPSRVAILWCMHFAKLPGDGREPKHSKFKPKIFSGNTNDWAIPVSVGLLLNNIQVKHENTAATCKFLRRSNASLQILDISDVRAGIQGLVSVCSSLGASGQDERHNTTLQYLDIGAPIIHQQQVRPPQRHWRMETAHTYIHLDRTLVHETARLIHQTAHCSFARSTLLCFIASYLYLCFPDFKHGMLRIWLLSFENQAP